MFNRFSAIVIIILSFGLSACVIGAPPGFSSGDKWEFPLIAPLENSVILVPVFINSKGPYIFMIDPDSPVSSIDAAIYSEQKLRAFEQARQPDERDTRVRVVVAEVLKIKIGSLTVSNKRLRVHDYGTYWYGGRKIRGLLGRDIIADSLILSVDRDRGIAILATAGHMHAPGDATVVDFGRYTFNYSPNAPKRLTLAHVNGKKMSLHIDLGAPSSMLWENKIDELGLPKEPGNRTVADELGTKRNTSYSATGTLSVANASADSIRFIPFGDKRIRKVDIDGAIGQDYWSRFNLIANWHKKKLFLSNRDPNLGTRATERMNRWGAAFKECSNPACVNITLEKKPLQNGEHLFKMTLVREEKAPDSSYEVLLEGVGAKGFLTTHPFIVATIPKGVRTIHQTWQANFPADTEFRVVDASPFPRECKTVPNCIWELGRTH